MSKLFLVCLFGGSNLEVLCINKTGQAVDFTHLVDRAQIQQLHKHWDKFLMKIFSILFPFSLESGSSQRNFILIVIYSIDSLHTKWFSCHQNGFFVISQLYMC